MSFIFAFQMLMSTVDSWYIPVILAGVYTVDALLLCVYMDGALSIYCLNIDP